MVHAAVVEHQDQRRFRRGASRRADCDAFDDAHGRLVRRRVFASTEAAALDTLSGRHRHAGHAGAGCVKQPDAKSP